MGAVMGAHGGRAASGDESCCTLTLLLLLLHVCDALVASVWNSGEEMLNGGGCL